MADYLLDTNYAASLITLNHSVRHQVLSRQQAGHTFAVTVPVVAETLFGIGVLPRAAQNLAEWARIRPKFICYALDEDDAETAAALQRMLRSRGWQLETVDAFIAVVALRYDLVLLTSDKDFNAVPGLSLENWMP